MANKNKGSKIEIKNLQNISYELLSKPYRA